jgi:hypothetical protein
MPIPSINELYIWSNADDVSYRASVAPKFSNYVGNYLNNTNNLRNQVLGSTLYTSDGGEKRIISFFTGGILEDLLGGAPPAPSNILTGTVSITLTLGLELDNQNNARICLLLGSTDGTAMYNFEKRYTGVNGNAVVPVWKIDNNNAKTQITEAQFIVLRNAFVNGVTENNKVVKGFDIFADTVPNLVFLINKKDIRALLYNQTIQAPAANDPVIEFTLAIRHDDPLPGTDVERKYFVFLAKDPSINPATNFYAARAWPTVKYRHE